jgi:DNA polymerase-1
VLEQKNLWDLFQLESRLIPMLLAMKARGVLVNLKKAQAMRDRLVAERDALVDEVKRATGHEVDIWAAKSIAAAFSALGLEYPLTPKTKQPSFTATFLDRHEHPMCQMIVEARRKDKMVGTFLDGGIFESHVQGRIHTQFNQLKSDEGGAISGRFSSSSPNLQFIPVRTEEGRLIREMFEPEKGRKWYKLDWSQIEYRLMVHDAAHLGFPGAREVVQQYVDDPDVDFHQIVADMTGLSRSSAKTINFGLAYGEGEEKLARQLGLSADEAHELLSEYHRRAPFLRRLMTHMSSLAAKTGEVRTLLNRLRTFNTWEAKRRNPETGKLEVFFVRQRIPGSKRAFTYRALNARIQGGAADIMKKAMVDIWESGVCDDLGGVPCLTVHDELDGELPPGRVAKAALMEMKRMMEQVVELSVPLKVDLGIGANWAEAK